MTKKVVQVSQIPELGCAYSRSCQYHLLSSGCVTALLGGDCQTPARREILEGLRLFPSSKQARRK